MKALKKIVAMQNHWIKYTQSFTSYRERVNMSTMNMRSGRLKIRPRIKNLKVLRSTAMTSLKAGHRFHLGKTEKK